MDAGAKAGSDGKRGEPLEPRAALEGEEDGEFGLAEKAVAAGDRAVVSEELGVDLAERLAGRDRLPDERHGPPVTAHDREPVGHQSRRGERRHAGEIGVVAQVLDREKPGAFGDEQRDRDLADQEAMEQLLRPRVRPIRADAFEPRAAIGQELEAGGGRRPDRVAMHGLALQARAHQAVVEVGAQPPLCPAPRRERQALDLAGREHAGEGNVAEDGEVARGTYRRAGR